jgi:eukaryotic-like serine/threonine-protein kinase
MNFEVGSTVGDYQIVAILGAGGMGKVYKVRNLISDRVEAMKVLLPDLVTEPELADRFLREIKVQASLEHPNIAALHTAVRVENQLLMLMEFVEGTTLEQKLKDGPLPVGEAVDYIRQVLSALEYAHQHGVIHRDLKPANMMLTPYGTVKLMDFGIAKASTDRRLTMTGTTVGSLYYMSPEQIQGAGGVDARSDLYSLGVSLYELVTGKKPFDGDSQYAIMAAHLEKSPVPPIQVDPRLPQLLNDVILMSVQKDPNARFQSAGALRNALGSLAGPETTPLAAPATATAPPRSKRGLWMALGAVATALAVVGVIELGPHKGTKAQIPPSVPIETPAQSNPAPVTQPPVTEPPPQTQQPQIQQPQTPASAPASVTQPDVAKPSRPAPQPAQKPAVQQPAVQQPVTQQPAAQQPAVVQQSPVQQPPATQPAPQQPPAQQPAASQQAEAATRAALQQVREELGQLNVRAKGIRGGLQRLEAQMNGHGLNASLQGPLDLMNNYLDEAANAMNSGDAASAKSYYAKAEKQVEILEKALNR